MSRSKLLEWFGVDRDDVEPFKFYFKSVLDTENFGKFIDAFNNISRARVSDSFEIDFRGEGSTTLYTVTNPVFQIDYGPTQMQLKQYIAYKADDDSLAIFVFKNENFQLNIIVPCTFYDLAKNDILRINRRLDDDEYIYLIYQNNNVTTALTEWAIFNPTLLIKGGAQKRAKPASAATVVELQQRCRRRGIKYSGLKKSELITALRFAKK